MFAYIEYRSWFFNSFTHCPVYPHYAAEIIMSSVRASDPLSQTSIALGNGGA